MTYKTRQPARATTPPTYPGAADAPKTQAKPTEPAEVAGRHKNDGSKDHKGAR